jgi:hypothetical protein
LALVTVGMGAASVARAQLVHGVLVAANDSEPVPYGTVIGPDSTGRFTDARGRFSLGTLAAGQYRLRARMLGFLPLDTTVSISASPLPIVLLMRRLAIRLATIPVTAKRSEGCVATGFQNTKDPELAKVFSQLNTNADRYKLLLDKYPFRYRREETEYVETTYQNSLADSTIWEDTTEYDSRQRRPYQPGDVVFTQAADNGEQRKLMYLPTFQDLADSAFDAAHCFAYMGQKKNEIRIDFRPADRIKTPDVDGSIYLDAKRFMVRRATFRLTKPQQLTPPIISLEVTTTFEEIVPLVPIFGVTTTEQPLPPIRTDGIDPSTFSYHPLVLRVVIERDHVLGHEFIADTIGSQTATRPPPVQTAQSAPPPAPAVQAIRISCTMPPSFETTEMPIYGTLTAVPALGPRGPQVLAAIRHQFHLPDNVSLPVYGYEFDKKVAPTLTGQVTFNLNGAGHVTDAEISATSLTALVDSMLIGAVRRADSTHTFPTGAGGNYALSLSSAVPRTGAQSTEFARVAVPVTPLAHTATIDQDSPPANLPAGNGMFEFVVDEHGHAMTKTLRTVSSSSGNFARAVARALELLRFDPAVTGTCPVKQVVMQPFQATLRVEPQ